MGLQKQNVPINFAGGMNTKVDSKQLPLGTFYEVKNGVYTSPLQLEKRNGYDAKSMEIEDGTTLSDVQSIARQSNTLIATTDSDLYTFAPSLNKWVEKGHVSNLSVENSTVVRNNYNQTKVSMDSTDGMAAYVWKDNRGGCRYSIIDTESNTSFVSDAVLDASAENPKVIARQGAFYFFYTITTTLRYKKVELIDPTTLSSATTVKSNLDSSDPVYDLDTAQNTIYCAFSSTNAGAELALFSIDSTDTASANTYVTSAHPTTTISLYCDPADRLIVSYYDGTVVATTIYPFSITAALLAPTTIETIASVDNISCISPSDKNYVVYYTVTNATASKYTIRSATLTYAGAVGTPAVFLRSVGQASKPIRYNSATYFLVVHDSTLQAAYFLVNGDAQVEGKISPALGGTVLPENSLPKLSSVTDDTFLLVTQVKSQLYSEGGTFFSTLGVNSSLINFVPSINYQDASLGKSLYITGGILRSFDGTNIVEDGFFVYPEGLTASTNNAAGGSMSNGTRLYAAVYAWYDNAGRLQRSSTSISLSTTQAAGGSTQNQLIIVPTLRLTYKTAPIIELYRTENNGTVFYKVTSTTSPTFNDATVDTVTITDTLSDTTLITKELMYTTGGVLDNDQAPNASKIVNWKNRLWLAGLEDSQVLAYSKELVEGGTVEFSDFLRLRISDSVGAITALVVLDDKLIIFKASSIFALAGNGPTSSGAQNDYGTPEQISSDVGCTDLSSIVNTPNGLMFKSQKGIYLLDRGLSTTYIGAEVEVYNSLTVNSGALVPNTNQVRFLTSGDIALVYDYLVERWTIFDNHGGVDAVLIDNTYTYLRNDGQIFEENSSFLDNNESINLQIDTGWISFAGIQGFQRVYKMLALGEFKSAHRLRIQCSYDYLNAVIHEKIIDSEDIVNSTVFGDGATYGSESLYGGEDSLNAYQFRVDMKTQKTQSIRIKIKELQNDVYGEGLAISNLAFEIGVKQGLGKIGQSRIKGVA